MTYLRKGVPSLFASVKPVYKRARLGPTKGGWSAAPVEGEGAVVASNKERVVTIGALVESYLETLRAGSAFPGGGGEETLEPPTVLLWTLLFSAQHFDMLGDQVRRALAPASALALLCRVMHKYRRLDLNTRAPKACLVRMLFLIARQSEGCSNARRRPRCISFRALSLGADAVSRLPAAPPQEKALALIDEALEHTPTLVDLYQASGCFPPEALSLDVMIYTTSLHH